MPLVGTGVLLAATDSNDPDHEQCAQTLRNASRPRYRTGDRRDGVPHRPQLGAQAESAFFASLAAAAILIETLTPTGLARVAELTAEYVDLPLGGTDASVIVIAERNAQVIVATLDHRHFAVVRPAHATAFKIVP